MTLMAGNIVNMLEATGSHTSKGLTQEVFMVIEFGLNLKQNKNELEPTQQHMNSNNDFSPFTILVSAFLKSTSRN